MRYELWDFESANLLGTFETRAAALAMVRAAIGRHARGYVDARGLGRTDEAGLDEPLLEGPDLADASLKPVRA